MISFPISIRSASVSSECTSQNYKSTRNNKLISMTALCYYCLELRKKSNDGEMSKNERKKNTHDID